MLRLLNLQNATLWRTGAWNSEMTGTLWEVWVYHLVRLTGRSVCSKKADEESSDVHFSHFTVEDRVFDSNMDGFSSLSGKLFAVLVYYHEVENVWNGCLKCFACQQHWLHDYCVLLLCFPNICWILLHKKSCSFLLGSTICIYVLF